MTIQNALNAAIAHHQAGRLREAEMLYRQILARDPNHADVLHRLGVLAGQVNRHDIELELIRRTVALQPNFPEARYSLGNALKNNGRLDEAIEAYRQAISLNPKFVDAHNNLGNALRDKGLLDDAIVCYRNTLKLAPDYPPAQINLGDTLRLIGEIPEAIECLKRAAAVSPGNPAAIGLLGLALHAGGNMDEAIPLYRQALAIAPRYLDAINNLASALRDKGELEESIALYRQALAINPNFAEAHSNLGGALQDSGQIDEAIACFHRAMQINPAYADVYSNLGAALQGKGNYDEAITACEKAIELNRTMQTNPANAEAYSNLGAALQGKGKFDEAISACEKAVELNPALAGARLNLGKAVSDVGRVEEAISHFRKAVVTNPKLIDAHSNLVFALNFPPNLQAKAIFQEHRRFDEFHGQPLAGKIEPHHNDPSPERRLKIGYVSADFKAHSVAWFFEGLLAHHDPAAVEVFCYANVKSPDAVTARLRNLAHQWRDTTRDEKMAAQVREDQIDILVDLSGHTAGNRLLAFARKPAPIQVTYLGYPNTTGLSSIDYRLTDGYADPPGMTDAFHSEKLVRLPETFLCYRPPENSPPVAPPPALKAGHVTFGSFNALPKITADMVGIWAQILNRLPSSRMLMKNISLADGAGRRRLLELFAAVGIAEDRLDLRGWIATRDSHLELYGQIDIALDTYPYQGTTTTCEALWMGVPVVALAGTSHRSRVGVSILSNLGLAELIAADPEQYVRLAVDLANDLPRLTEIRAGLRDRMLRSPLTDAPRFARNVESAYRQMWRTWCESHAKS